MIIFNTTFHVEDEVCEDYIRFMKDIYIRQAASGGFLHQPRFARIHAQHEENGTSYSLQFKVKNIDTLNHWFATEGQILQKRLTETFGNKAVGFVTLLEEIDIE